ncbi:MAG: tautomerase family protein [Candidatus Dormiibacterota bacterium]
MPVVNIELPSGSDDETKTRLIREVAVVVADVTACSVSDVTTILDEVPRENWGRGILRQGSPPAESSKLLVRADHATIFRFVCPAEVESAYLDLRRDVLNPGMRTNDGFVSSTLLRVKGSPGEYYAINSWISKEAEEAFVASPKHDETREHAIKLMPQGLEKIAVVDVVHLDQPRRGL